VLRAKCYPCTRIIPTEKNTASANAAGDVGAFGLVHLGWADGPRLGGNTLAGNANFDLLVETEAAGARWALPSNARDRRTIR